jgi:ribose transport system substrate-binding protein
VFKKLGGVSMGKRTWVLAIVIAVLFGAIGWAAPSNPPWDTSLISNHDARVNIVVDTTRFKKAPPWTIGFSNADMGDPWRVFFNDQIVAVAKKDPRIKQIYTTDANNSPSKQLADVEDLLAKGVDAILISACTEDAALGALQEAYAKNIPIVCVDRSTSSPYFVTQVFCDQVYLGKLAAEALVKELDGKGNIVILQGNAGSGPTRDRQKGFDGVLANYPNIKVLATVPCDWSTAKGKSAMEDLLVSHKDINGVLSESGIMTVGAYEAAAEANRLGELKWGEVDCYNGWMKLLATGKLSGGSGAESTTWCGAQGLEAVVKILEGKPVPGMIYTPTVVVDKSNVAKYVMLDSPDTYWINFLGRGYAAGKGPTYTDLIGADWYGDWVAKAKKAGVKFPAN